ncbi:MAG: phosphatidate cytidylyltransferase [Candidatus Marinimicrobia bacterium]|nr:phosphatidate cytidylyltransferase [Candidatus Neomarinimicrobiota bacterium]MBL7022752.1 phosphatidate cytidylyltransferase [Candidatus Neomarinimicrobiota bacterium]MBL7109610.1 phosphatidate cytidylyltransferase [Candidatus Neomarinimicrobiota bacterium]
MLETLRKRALVFIVGIPALIAVTIYGGVWFMLFTLLITVLGGLEALKFAHFSTSKSTSIIVVLSIILIVTSFQYCSADYLLILATITLIILFFEIFKNQPNPFENVSVSLFSIVWMGVLLGSLVLVRNIPTIGKYLTIVMFVSVWSCDTLAYIFGSAFGKKKILERVSPKKSWVGSIAGLLGSLIVVFIFKHFGLLEISYKDVIILGIIFGGFSQLGDFAESLFKRSADIKDSSNLLPGHGGVLDRFDSMAIAAPLTYLYWTIVHFM